MEDQGDYEALHQLMLEQEAFELDQAYNEWLSMQSERSDDDLKIMEEYYGQN